MTFQISFQVNFIWLGFLAQIVLFDAQPDRHILMLISKMRGSEYIHRKMGITAIGKDVNNLKAELQIMDTKESAGASSASGL